jgi:DNA/RNA endonuclease YhcR with UshA esterase domain
MRRVLVLLVLVSCLLAAATASAQPMSAVATKASCAGAVSWQSASRMIGRVATIKGRVVGTKYASSSNGSPTFLDVGAAYPSSRRFTVVIWIENRSAFGRPEARYRGHTICVRGRVTSYGGVAEIEASSPSQIAIAG